MPLHHDQDVQRNLSAISSIQIAKYFWGANACCKDDIKLFKVFNGNGEPFLEVIDATDCKTRFWCSGARRKFVCTDTQLLNTFIIMKLISRCCHHASFKVNSKHLQIKSIFIFIFSNRSCIPLTDLLEM